MVSVNHLQISSKSKMFNLTSRLAVKLVGKKLVLSVWHYAYITQNYGACISRKILCSHRCVKAFKRYNYYDCLNEIATLQDIDSNQEEHSKNIDRSLSSLKDEHTVLTRQASFPGTTDGNQSNDLITKA